MISKAKYRWMILLVLVLLVSNIVLAFFLFSKGKKPDYKKQAEERAMSVYKEIGLDSLQIDSFKASKDAFLKEMKPMWGDLRNLKDSLYRSLPINPDDSSIVALLDSIAAKSRENERRAFAHFHHLRNMCTVDQQTRFDTIMPKFLNRNRSRR
jgi:hypothetical protein